MFSSQLLNRYLNYAFYEKIREIFFGFQQFERVKLTWLTESHVFA